MTTTDDEPMTLTETLVLAVLMRVAATLLERFNDEYDYHPTYGDWSPKSLRYEADYLTNYAQRELMP
jgi:hypothetical protein